MCRDHMPIYAILTYTQGPRHSNLKINAIKVIKHFAKISDIKKISDIEISDISFENTNNNNHLSI